jgi:iron complex outermembrane receptor protein
MVRSRLALSSLGSALLLTALQAGAQPPGADSAAPTVPRGDMTMAESVTPPVLRSSPSAAWPSGHERAHDAVVLVALVVGLDGSVEDASVAQGLGEPLDSAALSAARGFVFTPARDARGARRARVRVALRFTGVAVAEPVPSGVEPAASGLANTPAAPAVTNVDVRGQAPPRSASATTIDERQMTAAPHRNASELLLLVPGVFVSQHSGEGKAHQIFFRGFDAVHGQDVELWAGGAPVNEVSNIHGQGYADLHFLIPEVVRRIESTPGVYDPRQGDFAVAGTLRFELGYDEPGVSASAALGSFGRRRYFMAYRPESASSETFAAFELESSDGFGPSRAARHGSAIAQVMHDMGPVAARVMASTYAGRFDSAGVLPLADIERNVVDRLATYDGKQGGYSSRTQLVLELRARAEQAWSSPALNDQGASDVAEPERWSLSPYVVFRSLKLRSNFTGNLTSSEGDSYQQLNEATTLGATGWYRRSLPLSSARDSLEAGVSLRSDAVRQSQHRLSTLNDRVTDDEQSQGIDAEVRGSDVAGYLDLALHPLDRLSLRAGLRADALSYMTEDRGGAAQGQTRSALGAQLSKRATLDVAVLPRLHALVSYGEGFRSPQARSLGDGETTPFTRVTSVEGGLRYRSGETLRASAAMFYTRLSDDLVFDPATVRNELVPATRRLGAAINAVYEPSELLLASGSFTYTRATFAAGNGLYARGDLLPYVPQIVARGDVALTPELGEVLGWGTLRAHLGVAGTFLGRRPLPYSELGHDVSLLDARASLRLGPFETSLDVFNVLGADWYDGEFVYASAFAGAASLVPQRHVTVGPPRSFVWSLTLFV